MSVSPLANDPTKLRAQVYDPATGSRLSVPKVLGLKRGEGVWPNTKKGRREAEAAVYRATLLLSGRGTELAGIVTVAEWRERWLTDPLYARPKESTMIHNRERTKKFADRYGHLPIGDVSDILVAQWVRDEGRGTVPALRVMFNDAMKPLAGRLVQINPFANLGLPSSKGNKNRKPPSMEQMEAMVALAWDVTTPSFAAYLEFSCCVGIRPSETDALRPEKVDLDGGVVDVDEQWNAKVRTFTEPKYGPYRVALVDRAKEVLLRLREDREQGCDEFLFMTTRGHHFTPSTRDHHWNRVRCGVGLPKMTLYLATRHFFGWYALNILQLAPHIVAEQFGHRDGGRLVRELYGHPDRDIAHQAIRDAHNAQGRLRLLHSPQELAG